MSENLFVNDVKKIICKWSKENKKQNLWIGEMVLIKETYYLKNIFLI